jgi:hypothetical protein
VRWIMRDTWWHLHIIAREHAKLYPMITFVIMGDMRSAIPDVDQPAPYFRNEATMPSLRNARELGKTVCGLKDTINYCLPFLTLPP